MILKQISALFLISYIAYACSPKTNTAGQQARSNEPVKTPAIVTPADYQYTDDTVFSLLSWNVEHFVDAYDDPYIENRREDSPPENMQERTSLFIQALRKANADIVMLQEFESAKFLKKLAEDSLSTMGYRFFADVPSHNWYMNVVVMSKFPMGVLRSYGSATTPLIGYIGEDGQKETQNHINTRMWTIDIYPAEGYDFSLTGLHLKAGRSARDAAMRKGQINLLIEEFNNTLRLDASKNMIVAGDLNAIPGTEELNLLVDNSQLKNAFVDTIEPNVFSHPADKPSRRLDHMLVNKNMLAETLEDSIQVKYFFSNDSMRTISDHLPVMGYFYKQDN